jgi:hypothetical protein
VRCPGHRDVNPVVGPFKFREDKRARDQRAAWTVPQLNELFKALIWTGGAKSRARRYDPGAVVIEDDCQDTEVTKLSGSIERQRSIRCRFCASPSTLFSHWLRGISLASRSIAATVLFLRRLHAQLL